MKDIKKTVRDGYAKIALKGTSCCSSADTAKAVGYSAKEISAVPEGANLGLGCGNPVALALLKTGDVVVDLGSGAGFDAFLASAKVGKTGRVIGIDMTPEMIEKATRNLRNGNYANVEFRLGEIENLPVEDNCADMVLSNCVINLSPDKEKVFQEAYRVLKPAGKMLISDLVLARPLPEKIKRDAKAYLGCLAGAVLEADYLRAIRRAGFVEVEIVEKNRYPVQLKCVDPEDVLLIEKAVMSVKIRAGKKA
jgi:SAM-dependent methyltransferase